MILIDTSVWIDHLRAADQRLTDLLYAKRVLAHRLVIEELACGHIKDRGEVLDLMHALPSAPVVSHEEILYLVSGRKLFGRGLGAVDVHLIASAMLGRAKIWSRDKALAREAARLNVAV